MQHDTARPNDTELETPAMREEDHELGLHDEVANDKCWRCCPSLGGLNGHP